MKEIASRETTEYILDNYHLHALKKFGQNFLIDTGVVQRIIESSEIDKETCVIEIGPGIGALTEALVNEAGYVQCYEIDTRFEPVHKEFLNVDNCSILYEDFLKVDVEEVVQEFKKNYSKVIVVANLPYYITTKIMEKVILCQHHVDGMICMVQQEVAKKMTKNYQHPLGLMINDMGTITYQFTVPKQAFIPKPHIESAILKIELPQPFDLKLYQVIECAFSQKRKTIYNNLKKKYPSIKEVLQKSNLNGQLRCEQLQIEDFKIITKYL